jgi:hypothetical protein
MPLFCKLAKDKVINVRISLAKVIQNLHTQRSPLLKESEMELAVNTLLNDDCLDVKNQIGHLRKHKVNEKKQLLEEENFKSINQGQMLSGLREEASHGKLTLDEIKLLGKDPKGIKFELGNTAQAQPKTAPKTAPAPAPKAEKKTVKVAPAKPANADKPQPKKLEKKSNDQKPTNLEPEAENEPLLEDPIVSAQPNSDTILLTQESIDAQVQIEAAPVQI